MILSEMQERRLGCTSGQLLRHIVPDIVRKAFEYTRTGHEVQAIARPMRIWPEERRVLNPHEVQVGILRRGENFLYAYQPDSLS